jgi:uncharacterized protein YbjQ (UPF0145 family)
MNQGFQTVTVGVSQLLDKLKENREVHVETHNKACEAFRETAYKKLRSRAEQIKSGATVNMTFTYHAPKSHVEEYDDVIGMLEFSLATAGEAHANPTVELDKQQYRNYVEDKWTWTHDWGVSVSGYCGLL